MEHFATDVSNPPSVATTLVSRNVLRHAFDRPALVDSAAAVVPSFSEGKKAPSVAAAGRSIDPTLMQTMVADAVRRVLAESDGEAPAKASASAEDVTVTAASRSSLNDSVIAAHEQRIALLRDRIDSICETSAETAMIDTLRDRLRLAEAARRLAVARLGTILPGSERSADRETGNCRTPVRDLGFASLGRRGDRVVMIAHRLRRTLLAATQQRLKSGVGALRRTRGDDAPEAKADRPRGSGYRARGPEPLIEAGPPIAFKNLLGGL